MVFKSPRVGGWYVVGLIVDTPRAAPKYCIKPIYQMIWNDYRLHHIVCIVEQHMYILRLPATKYADFVIIAGMNIHKYIYVKCMYIRSCICARYATKFSHNV